MKIVKDMFYIPILAASLLMLTSGLYGASDGISGLTSTGSSAVSINLQKLIIVTRFNNLTWTYSGTGDFTRGDNISVATNYGTAATRSYSVQISGSGVAGAFTITNGVETLPYAVWFNDNTGFPGSVQVLNGVSLGTQTGANRPLSDNSTNAYYRIVIDEADITAVDAGLYTGSISVVVQPE